MSQQPQGKTYGLTPSQQTMHYMLKYSLHKQVMQIPMSLTIDAELDFDTLQKALNEEIKRNDCMRLRFIKEKGEIKQYFLPEIPEVQASVLHFKTQEEQQAHLTADAQKPIKFLKGEIFRVIFFRSYDGGTGIYINVCHLNMDAMAVFVFFSDFLNVYNALKDGTPMPEPLFSFADVIDKEFQYLANKERYDKDAAFYRDFFLKDGEPFYAGVHGMDLLEKERKKKKKPDLRVPSAFDPIHDKAEMIHRHMDAQTTKQVLAFCEKNSISPACVIELGLRTHSSKINERNPDIYFMDLCSRRVTFKEKQTGGCLTQPLPMRSVIGEDKTFQQGIEQISGIRSQLYRHMNFPYMHARHMVQEIYSYSMAASPSSLMFTWLPLEFKNDKNWQYEFSGYSLGRYIMPLYAFAVPNLKNGGMDFYYMYRTSTISAAQINALHDNTVKVMSSGAENPSVTIGALLDSI